MKKIFAILAVLLLASCGKYPTPVPEKNTANFEKNGGTETIFISGEPSFTENDRMNYKIEFEEDHNGLTTSITMKCGWVNFKLQYFYYDNSINLNYTEANLIITTEPNDTGKERDFKLKLVHGRDVTSRPGEAIITVIQKGE